MLREDLREAENADLPQFSAQARRAARPEKQPGGHRPRRHGYGCHPEGPRMDEDAHQAERWYGKGWMFGRVYEPPGAHSQRLGDGSKRRKLQADSSHGSVQAGRSRGAELDAGRY